MVGIAFALGFTVGPSLGALFSSFHVFDVLPSVVTSRLPFHRYSGPALFAVLLLVIETTYLIIYLPETKGYLSKQNESQIASDSLKEEFHKSDKIVQRRSKRIESTPKSPPIKTTRIQTDKTKNVKIYQLYGVIFVFLFIFSGIEFTLAFLTHDKFNYTNMQQGILLGFMGLSSSVVQGGYVRRQADKDSRILIQGLISCAIGLLLLIFSLNEWILYSAVFFLSFTSATVVNSINSQVSKLASEQTDVEEGTGKIMGNLRAAGQLGRCLGPCTACCFYWLLSGEITYAMSLLSICILLSYIMRIV